MRIDIISIFPEYFHSPLKQSLIAKAIDSDNLAISAHDLREYSTDKHRKVDDTPYGGGPGMVMTAQPFYGAVNDVTGRSDSDYPDGTRVIMMAANGRRLDHALCSELASAKHIVLLCGRYEGIDARVEDNLCTDVLSVGDYVLMGGEAAALTVIESVVRLIPGIIGSEESIVTESYSIEGLEYPQYTKPAEFKGASVPETLLSGDHARIEKWRMDAGRNRTEKYRPDLL